MRVNLSLVEVARKARMMSTPSETDICTLLFRHKKTRKASRLFLEWLKENGQAASRREISQFGRELQGGQIEEDFTFSRKSFYTTILRRLVDLGLIGLRGRFDGKGRINEKYVPIYQPIPKRSPSRKNFWSIAWQICRKWNDEWLKP